MNFYSGLLNVRNWLYDHNILKSEGVTCPVISIGNLTVGGTGKTPVTEYLMQQLQKHSLKVGVISRGYRGNYQGTQEVDLKVQNFASVFGDEVSMLKSKFPTMPIFVSKKRVDAAKELLKNYKVDVILADDAYQHRHLKRDINILLVDATDTAGNQKVIPFGRSRESFIKGLKRADYVVLTKANLTTEQNLEAWKIFLKNQNLPYTIIQAGFYNHSFFHLGTLKKQKLPGHGSILFCGLAKPNIFFQALSKNNELNILKTVSYADHYDYTEKDVQHLLQLKDQFGADNLVTTYKDAIKLITYNQLKQYLWVADLDIEIQGIDKNGTEQNFIGTIIRTLRA